MKIGIIADDFTGATDAASFVVKNGLNAIQFSGIHDNVKKYDADALVVSLKTRSCDVHNAIAQSLKACNWLLEQGCALIYFKYCSTFDSTAQGNIGPVVEALMAHLDVSSTLICPALPVNGRTVYQGNLFVFDKPLNESSMKQHPITPMLDANLLRLIEAQSKGKAGLLDWHTLQTGTARSHNKIDEIVAHDKAFIICDSLTDGDLLTIAEIAVSHKLVTGGSGLVGAIAKIISESEGRDKGLERFEPVQQPQPRKGIVLSGSCSQMTNEQVNRYKNIAPSFMLDINKCMQDNHYVDEVVKWVTLQTESKHYPMVYATVQPDTLNIIQQKYGEKSSQQVEALFYSLVKRLSKKGYNTFISAGGETSGSVTQALSIKIFSVGREIAPGVPWVSSVDGNTKLALKSGNFGCENFFQRAQELII